MRKLLAVALVLMFALSLFAACGDKSDVYSGGDHGGSITSEDGQPEGSSDADETDSKRNVVDYTPGEGENNWNGLYYNRDEIYVEIYNFDGSGFSFEFYIWNSKGERVSKLKGDAEINPDNASDANFEDVNFTYSDENSIFVMNSGDYELPSGVYDREDSGSTDDVSGDGVEAGTLWQGMFITEDGKGLAFGGFDGQSFQFTFSTNDGELEDVAEVNPDNPELAGNDDYTFVFIDENTLVVSGGIIEGSYTRIIE